jgi:hypothetical protein
VDLRKPSGYFFTLLGIILLLRGALGPDRRPPLADWNVNLFGGAAIVLVGAVLLLLSLRARS